MAKWSPAKTIERLARQVLRVAANQVRNAAPRKPHRPGKVPPGPQGGSLPRRIVAKTMLRLTRWGVVINWASLGQPFMFYVNGTANQAARPVTLGVDRAQAVAACRSDMLRHYRARAEREP
jgi:hypothetical protein